MKLKRGVKLGTLLGCLIVIGVVILLAVNGAAAVIGLPFVMIGLFGMVFAAAFNRFETLNKFLEWMDKDD